MAESGDKKSGRAKVFDVARPGKSKADIGSKPMIVGHRSLASDPMMRDDTDKDEPDSVLVDKNVTQSSKVKIEPITDEFTPSSDDKPADADKPNTEDTILLDDKIEPNLLLEESAAEPDEPEPTRSDNDETDGAKKDDPSGADETLVSDIASETDAVDTVITDANGGEPIREVRDQSENRESKEKEKELDPAAIEMERSDNLRKVIESKKYHLAIKETATPGSQKNVFVALIAILVGLLGLFVLIDLNVVNVGLELPFRVFGKETKSIDPVLQTQEKTSQVTEQNEVPVSDNDQISANSLVTTDGKSAAEQNLYQNKDHGVDFYYPSNWKRYIPRAEQTLSDSELEITWLYSEDYNRVVSDSGVTETGVLVSFKITESNVSSSDERALDLKNADNVFYDKETVEVLEVNNVEVVRYRNDDRSKSITYEWIKDSRIYRLDYADVGSSKTEESESVASYSGFLEILNSVKFYDPVPLNDL